jgi:hypothetical protein
MPTRMTTSHTTQSAEDYLGDFAGRLEMPGWDETKPNKVADENREFVWPPEMWEALIQSIFAGYTVPQITICDNLIMDGGNRSVVLMKFRRGEFTVRFEGWEGTYATMPPALIARWHSCVIPLTIIRNATREERSQIYENLNKGIKLTPGQLLKNRQYHPLARVAYFLLGRAVDGLVTPQMREVRNLICVVFKTTFNATKQLNEVAHMYKVVAASQFGPEHYHTSFARHLSKLMTITDGEINLSNLEFILRTIRSVDPDGNIPEKKKAAVFKDFCGGMIYDVHHHRDTFAAKWTNFVRAAYDAIPHAQLKSLKDVGNARAQALPHTRRLSEKVDMFLRGDFWDNTETDTDEDDTDTE